MPRCPGFGSVRYERKATKLRLQKSVVLVVLAIAALSIPAQAVAGASTQERFRPRIRVGTLAGGTVLVSRICVQLKGLDDKKQAAWAAKAPLSGLRQATEQAKAAVNAYLRTHGTTLPPAQYRYAQQLQSTYSAAVSRYNAQVAAYNAAADRHNAVLRACRA